MPGQPSPDRQSALTRSTPAREAAEFDEYLRVARDGLLAAMAEPASFQPLLKTVGDVKITRVLDVGCGLGQMLYPFVALKGAQGVGVDESPQACRMGREFYAEHVPDARVNFVYGQAETLPFPDACFDAVNCGLALPYMDNARALDEIARVLRPGGILLLKIHHARYYLRDLWRGLASRRILQTIHAGRVLAVGALYHLTGNQPDNRLLGKETFQTRWLLSRELAQRGCAIKAERADGTRRAPAFVISKQG